MTSDILLVRHGGTPWTDAGRVQGWAPVPLSERGREQARAVGAHVTTEYNVSRLVTSDLRRARETASVIADACEGVTVETDAALRERDFGVYQGLDDEAFHALSSDEGYDDAVESGGSWRAVDERVQSWYDETLAPEGDGVLTPDDGGVTVVVSHFGPICMLLGALDGVDPEHRLDRSFPPCSLAPLSIDADGETTIGEHVTDIHG